MQMITFKLRPKTVLGIILALTGAVIIALTFISNHSGKAEQTSAAPVPCATAEERGAYLTSLGWEYGDETEKEITVPAVFNEVYENYNAVQKQQGFNLEKYKGKGAVIYTYPITNFKNNSNVIANLIVCDSVLIGADLCDPSAKDGFLIGLTAHDKT